jgi:hypothetical protein
MPTSKLPPAAIAVAPAMPKKVTAAGIAMVPPSTTSANSFVDAVVRPVSVTSSCLERYDEYAWIDPMPSESVKKTCPAAASHTLALPSAPQSGVQMNARPCSGLPDVGLRQRQHAHHDEEREDEEDRHAVERQLLDAARDAAGEHPDDHARA